MTFRPLPWVLRSHYNPYQAGLEFGQSPGKGRRADEPGIGEIKGGFSNSSSLTGINRATSHMVFIHMELVQ